MTRGAAFLPPVHLGAAVLYHGDALAVLPGLTGVADLVVTDAPYLLTSGGIATGSGAWTIAKGYDNGGAIVDCDLDWADFMPGVFAALKPDADAYFMANDKNVFACHGAARAAGFRLHNLLVWDKGTATPNRWFMKNLEFTVYAYKGRAKAINNPSAKQLLRAPNRTGAARACLPFQKPHPTEKPVELMAEYIRQSSQPGDVVLDPFMGSGSTGVAAIREGRRFIGIELKQNWFDLAAARIARAGDQGNLFGEAHG